MTVSLIDRWTRAGPWEIHAVDSVHQPPGTLPVVLVHGVVASCRYMIPTAEILGHHYRVVVPDMPGYGRSSKSGGALSVHALADSLALWLPAAGLGRVVLIANSFGCQVVTDLAARYPGLVAALVLLGPTVDAQAHSLLRQGLRLALDLPRERLSLIPLLIRDLLEMGMPRALGEIEAMMQERIENVLPLVSVPTLVLRGSKDPIAPRRWVEEVACLLPRGGWAELPGAPHAANYSCPGSLADAADGFIKRTGARE